MWITGDVELPDEILEAHELGELVFFVGAGASVDEPSNLPLFKDLAEQLAELASHPFPNEGNLDFYIGQLESLPQGFDAHFHAHKLISNPESRFNPLHKAIVNLAGIGGAFRVVTTNYDNHLLSAAEKESIEVPDIWYAPALPLGKDFTGLVHLHGSVSRPKDEMILTDCDFGHAYITEAWATRFLLPMFDRFTVVFIGYSHDDLIMQYLALGLPVSAKEKVSKRFAFTNDPEDRKWKYLGIQPIAYPLVAGDHQALLAALTSWDDRARMGKTDHQARMQAILEGSNGLLSWPDRDYLQDRLRTVDGARDFVRAAGLLPDRSKREWLVWLEDLSEFKKLFLAQDVTEATNILGRWFAETFIGSTTLNGAALQTLQRLKQSMTTSLYQSAGSFARNLAEEDEAASDRWQALLGTSIHGQSTPLKLTLFMSIPPNLMTPSVVVLRSVLRPFLKLEQRSFVDQSIEECENFPDAMVEWNSNQNELTEYILRIVENSVPGDRSLRSALEGAMIEAYDLLDAYHGKRSWDPLSFRRSAIETHAQDRFRRPLDAVIDGLREYGIKALPIMPDLPDQWWDHDRLLMQRLALHLVANDPERSADDKLQWLLDRAGLYERDLKHETYQVLASAVGNASTLLKRRVLDVATHGPGYSEGGSDTKHCCAYAKYNLLAWLIQADPAWVEARTEFDATQAENPEFTVREYPDLNAWTTSETWGAYPPIGIEEFTQALNDNAQFALNNLLSYDYSERNFDQLSWRDALKLVEQTVAQRPDLGVQLWDAVLGDSALGNRQVELWCAITEGWGNAQLQDSDLEVVERLTTLLKVKDAAHSIGSFLLNQIQQQLNSGESQLLASMRDMAQALWHEQGANFTYQKDLVPSFALSFLNSWPGFLAQYWGFEVERRWHQSGEEWAGLSDKESEALIELLKANGDARDATQPAIAKELYFYFVADPTFSEAHLLPLFNDSDRHAFAWCPFLDHLRWNDQLLEVGLFESTVIELSRLDDFPEQHLCCVFLKFVTSVVTLAGITNCNRRRLLDQTVIALNGALAGKFAGEVVRFLHDDRIDGAKVWRQWLGEHIERRINGQPRIASAEELARWADVVTLVGEHIPDAMTLFSECSIGLSEEFIAPKCPNVAFTSYGAELVDFFAKRVRNTTDFDDMVRYRVQHLVHVIQGMVDDAVVQPLLKAVEERVSPISANEQRSD